jgi:hypothetical protein
MKTRRWLLVVILVGLAAPQASADTESVSRSQMILFLADGISALPNTVTVLAGDGDAVMGWIGVGVGALSMVAGFTSEDGDWLAACGGIAVGMGVLSLVGSREDEELGTHQLRLVPGLARTDGALEPRLTLKLNF